MYCMCFLWTFGSSLFLEGHSGNRRPQGPYENLWKVWSWLLGHSIVFWSTHTPPPGLLAGHSPTITMKILTLASVLHICYVLHQIEIMETIEKNTCIFSHAKTGVCSTCILVAQQPSSPLTKKHTNTVKQYVCIVWHCLIKVLFS